MIEIYWYYNGNRIGVSKTPCIPRKGELVILDDISCEVLNIIWIFNEGINNSWVEINVRVL